jgi:hypothetical protein
MHIVMKLTGQYFTAKYAIILLSGEILCQKFLFTSCPPFSQICFRSWLWSTDDVDEGTSGRRYQEFPV